MSQTTASVLLASEEDIKKAQELNDSQNYDSLYIIPDLQALYYQNRHIIEILENINKKFNELLIIFKEKKETSSPR